MPDNSVYRRIAELHAGSIDQGFLSTLGVPFLAQLYRAIDESDESVLLYRSIDGRIVAFVSASAGMGPIYKHMLRHPLRLALALAPALLSFRKLIRIAETIRQGRRHETSDLTQPQPELLSIAVDRHHRGCGLAESLYRELCEHYRRRGANGFKIVVGEVLEPAHRFYRRMGAVAVGEVEVHRGAKSILYSQDLAGQDTQLETRMA